MVTLVHFEIPSSDYDRSNKFYSGLFDWKCEKMESMDYVFIGPVEEGAIGGGFSKELKPSPEMGISLYFEVDDINSSLAKAVELGGTEISPKTGIGPNAEYGYYGVFKDLDGNSIGLWSKGEPTT